MIMLAYMYITNFNMLSTLSGSVYVILGTGIIFIIIHSFFKKHELSFFKWRSGERGEKTILGELKKLSDEYCVFYDMPIKGIGNIDFIVIGPTGVFTIEVKNHAGVIGFNGTQLTHDGKLFEEKDVMNQAMSEALHLKELLPEVSFVHSMLVFSNYKASMHFGLNEIKHITVIGKPYLMKAITERPSIFDRKKVGEVEGKISNFYRA